MVRPSGHSTSLDSSLQRWSMRGAPRSKLCSLSKALGTICWDSQQSFLFNFFTEPPVCTQQESGSSSRQSLLVWVISVMNTRSSYSQGPSPTHCTHPVTSPYHCGGKSKRSLIGWKLLESSRRSTSLPPGVLGWLSSQNAPEPFEFVSI